MRRRIMMKTTLFKSRKGKTNSIFTLSFAMIEGLVALLILSVLFPSVVHASGFQLEPGFSYHEIPQEIRDLMLGKSYQENEYVNFNDLRLCKVKHIGFDGKTHQGELVVSHKAILENGEEIDLAKEVLVIFKELYDAQYPIEKIRLIDHYDADDETSMRDNNSSAFNFRYIRGTKKISWHSYGFAIDINPFQNPCFDRNSKFVEPAGSNDFLDRNLTAIGLIKEGDPCHKAFTSRGWEWGGTWDTPKDYMHFQKFPWYATKPAAKY